MLSILLVAALPLAGGDQRLLHAADADLHLEVVDAKAAWKAYEGAPMLKLLGGEQMKRLDAFGKQMGWDLGSVMGGMLPVTDPSRPDDRYWPWSNATAMSFSMRGMEATTGDDMGGTLVVDFADEAAASQALLALGAMKEGATTRETVTLGGRELEVSRYRTDMAQRSLAGWSVRDGTRIVAGMGGVEPADVATLAPAASCAAHPERYADDGLSAPAGTVVYRAWSDMDTLGAGADTGMLASFAEAQKWASGFLPFLGTRGKWRLELQGDRFATESLVERIGPAREMDAMMGVAPVPAEASSWVPAEAAGAWTTTVAQESFEQLLDRWLEVPATGEAGGLSSLVDSACAVYLMPYPALMQAAQSPPRIVVAMKTTDPAAFQRAMDAKAAAVLKADPKQRVDVKPYRRQPTWVFAAEEEDGQAEAKPAAQAAGPLGAFSADGLKMRPTVALMGDRVLVTLSPTIARSEIKRMLEEKERRPHPIANIGADGAFETSTMDWGGMLGGMWDQVRGLVPMLAQGGAEPVDMSLLPTSADLFAGFKPTRSWSRRVARENAPALVHSRSESSFGPETPLMMAGLMFLGSRAGGAGAEVVETLETKQPAPAAQAVDEAPARTTKALRTVKTALAVYKSQKNRYPASLDELLAGTDAFPDGFLADKKVPLDGWGRVPFYAAAADGASYELRSLGPDGADQSGGGDDVKAP